MRIEELYLDGFGHFHQRSLGPIKEPVTVFYGPNEAGKSTLLAFIRAILFGFPARFNSHYPPLAGGRHGGRITLSDGAGSVFDLERYAGARGGLSIATSDGPASNADAVLQRLTGSATSDLFRNVFAFSLDELQAASSLNDSNGTIYSAGQGAPGLPALSRSLSDHKGRIYLPRGNNQEVPRLVNLLRGIETQLIFIEGNTGRYGELTARKSQIGVDLQAADVGLSQMNARLAEINKLRAGWDLWVELSNCESQLRDMARFVNFPEDPIPRLDTIENEARRVREDHDDAAEQLRQSEESAAAVIPGEVLLDAAARIEAIRRTRSSFDNSVKDLPERQAELRGLEADLAGNLRELGHDWGEADMEALDTSLVVRNEVESWKQRIADSHELAQQAQLRMEQERRSLQTFQSESQEAQEKLPPEPPPLDAAALTERQGLLRVARDRLSEYERERQNLVTLRGQLNALTASQSPTQGANGQPNIPLLVLLGLVGAALIGAGIALGGDALPLGIGGGLALLAFAAYGYVAGKPTPSAAPSPMATALGQQTADAETAAETARQSLLDSAVALGIDEQPNAAALDSAAAHLESARNALDVWNAANERVTEASLRGKSQEQRVETAATEHEKAEASALDSQQEWRLWLRGRGLSEKLTADTMTTFLASVNTTRAVLSEARRMRDRVAAIEFDIAQFREQVEPLAVSHDILLNTGDKHQMDTTADELIKRLDEVKDRLSQRAQAKELEGENRQRLERQEQRCQLVEQELAALLAAGDADSTEDFRRRASENEKWRNVDHRRQELSGKLEFISGPGYRFDAFRNSLSNSDPNQLNEESDLLSEQHAEVDSRRNALREERGGIDNRLAQLTGEEESSALRIRRNTLLEQLREHAREWSRLTLAELLLEKTRQKFERERQPSVIRHAQEFFSGVTGQRYHRLYAPIGEQTITVTDSTGATKQPGVLSRGTREQLYLALRFGLIREFGEHAERLPVVVDEALVNFDPERAKQAAQAFAELAKTNQVLVFTCHPATADMFSNVGAQRVDIGPGSF